MTPRQQKSIWTRDLSDYWPIAGLITLAFGWFAYDAIMHPEKIPSWGLPGLLLKLGLVERYASIWIFISCTLYFATKTIQGFRKWSPM